MKNIKLATSIFVFLFIINFSFSVIIYIQFNDYRKDFKMHKVMHYAYQDNHKYQCDKFYKIINQTSDLPNGYRSYVVKGLTLKNDEFMEDDDVVREIDVPGDRFTYMTAKPNEDGSSPKFLTVAHVDGEEKTILFHNTESLLFYSKQ